MGEGLTQHLYSGAGLDRLDGEVTAISSGAGKASKQSMQMAGDRGEANALR